MVNHRRGGRSLVVAAVTLTLLAGFGAWKLMQGRSRLATRTSGAAARLGRDARRAVDRSAALDGVVTTAADHAPAAGAQVVLSRSADPGSGAWGGGVWTPRPEAATRADSSGHFRFDALAPGIYTVTASLLRPGLAPAVLQGISLGEGEVRPVQLAIQRGGGMFSGHVVDSGGGAIAGARIAALGFSGTGPLEGAPRFFLTAADNAGAFSLPLGRGMHRIFVEADGYAPLSDYLSIDGDVSKILKLDAAGAVSGRLVERGS